MTRITLFEQALKLPRKDRVRLVRRLLASLEGPADPNAAAAWVDELERRLKEARSGRVTPIEWSDVRKRLEQRFGAVK